MNYSNASFESNRLIPPKCHLKESKQSKSILKFANSSPVTTLLVVCCRQEHVVPKRKTWKTKRFLHWDAFTRGKLFRSANLNNISSSHPVILAWIKAMPRCPKPNSMCMRGFQRIAGMSCSLYAWHTKPVHHLSLSPYILLTLKF